MVILFAPFAFIYVHLAFSCVLSTPHIITEQTNSKKRVLVASAIMKIRNEFEKRHHHTCLNRDSAVCDNVNCTSAAEVIPCDADVRNSYDSTSRLNPDIVEEYDENEGVKELMVIGAGPHALALLLRLLEPEPDFWSDEERHKRAEKTKLMKHYHDVYRHLKNLSRGPSYTLKQTKKRKKSSHPPLTLKDIWESSLVVDAHGDWMSSWKRNFQNIGITKLRSLMNAHADPYDHRSMEYFAESNKRGHDLVTLKSLSQRDDKFRGPYQVPTTKLFHDFHDLLIKGYGIDSLVQKGFVRSINPVQNSRNTKEGLFEVKIDYGDKIKTFVTKRVVCALGPNFNKDQMWWEREINHKMSNISDNHNPKILSADEIVPWLETHERDCKKKEHGEKPMRLLVVGGGITSAQLALKAKKSPWCESVTFIQRSMSLSRHFDVENHWLGYVFVCFPFIYNEVFSVRSRFQQIDFSHEYF